jgi:TonB family protein
MNSLITITCVCFTIGLNAMAAPLSNDSTGIGTYDQLSNMRGDASRTDPVLIKFVKADYPPVLIKKGIEGRVSLDIFISAQGRVDSVALIRSVHRQLDSLALQAASQFEFKPATIGGEAEPVVLSYEYIFTIDPFLGTIKEYMDFSGSVREYGTRNPVRNAEISVAFIDSRVADSIAVPFSRYLGTIGNFSGQRLKDEKLITRSDSLGRFVFKSLPTSVCSIQVFSSEHQMYASRIEIDARHRPSSECDQPKLMRPIP